MALTDELNRVSFIAEDFATYRAEAEAFYQTNYPADFNDLVATNLGNALINQLAFAMQALAFMVNRRSSELFLDTAKLNKSIVKLARMLGYPIQPATPSFTDLTIAFPNAPYDFPVPVQPGFQFNGPGSIIYEYTGAASAILVPGQTSMTIPIREGQTKSVTFVSDGSANQQFSLFGIPSEENLYSDGFVVSVDGTVWQFESIIKYVSSNIYEVLFTDDPPLLRFGDNIAGNIPPQSSSIVVDYRFGFGSKGAVGSNQISSAVVDLVINGNTIPMTFTNPAANAGGDPEDIRHVKAFASSFFRTQNAAVVKDDYDTIAQLQPGVAIADAQIMRGINNDITIQAALKGLVSGSFLVESSVSGMQQSSVSGMSLLGVSGVSSLFVDGVSGLNVGGVPFLGVSGLQFLGADVSGNVTGIGFLGVSGITALQVVGQAGLIVNGISNLGVSGVSQVGIENQTQFVSDAASGSALIAAAAASLSGYLSVAFSDTSKANQVQVIVLGVDSNNAYIPPSAGVLTDVQVTLQGLADAVVTVKAVDGSSKLVPVSINVTLGISQTAVQSDVENLGLQALVASTIPYGLLVRRTPGVNLYRSDISQAVIAGNQTGDIVFINVDIISPTDLLDSEGNLIISAQQIVQNAAISVKAIKRLVGKTWVPIT